MDFWINVEAKLNCSVPPCIKIILEASGYSSELSLTEMNEENLLAVEAFVNNSVQNTIHQLKCCHSDTYKKQNEFKFIPGHKSLILKLPAIIKSDSIPMSLPMLCNQLIERFEHFPMVSNLLYEFLNVVALNTSRSKTQFRYSEIVQNFSTYIYTLCGRNCYEILSANLPMPNASTILKYIQMNKKKIAEGELRCAELANYLEKTNSPSIVWLAEDATGITEKVIYDVSSDQLIGIVLPLNGHAMPISNSYKAKSISDIEKFMKKEKSTHAYIIMAQPINAKTPPFLLQIYGINNKFTTNDVLSRWEFTVAELKKFGITVLGISSDGDTRLLRSMKINTNFQINPLVLEEYSKFSNLNISYSQDATHIGTKLRNRLLTPSIILPLGNFQISVAHFKMLILSVAKDIHGLVHNDICPDDRQNFSSLQKIMEPRVTEALRKYIIDSDGTVAYIKLCKFVTSSFMDPSLSPLDRIFRAYYSIFFIRSWAKWLIENNFDLDKNFISSNASDCIEINGICLLGLIVKLREQNTPNLFQTVLFDSQHCERFFRQLRSMTTMNYTRINFPLHDLLHLIQRVELQYDIIYNKLMGKGIVFPRIKIGDATPNDAPTSTLPSNEELMTAIKNAQVEAMNDLSKLGINISETDIGNCAMKVQASKKKDGNDIAFDENEESDIFSSILTNRTEPLNLTGHHFVPEKENDNKFIMVCDEDGNEKFVRKSSLVWLLSDQKKNLATIA